MRPTKKIAVAVSAAALMTIITPLGASPAHAANENHFEIEFSDTHECTHEQVIGETKVHATTTETDNGDGTSTVTVKQHQHGSHLEGVFSGDEYVLNEQSEIQETFIISTSLGGVIHTHTTFNHKGEDQAFTEVPGDDDLQQRVTFTFPPVGDPIMVQNTTRCH